MSDYEARHQQALNQLHQVLDERLKRGDVMEMTTEHLAQQLSKAAHQSHLLVADLAFVFQLSDEDRLQLRKQAASFLEASYAARRRMRELGFVIFDEP